MGKGALEVTQERPLARLREVTAIEGSFAFYFKGRIISIEHSLFKWENVV